MSGVAKLSQNRPAVDRATVKEAVATGTPSERVIARAMDELA
jgi:predicted FMN-binding regulatory protein PaiB